MLIVFTSFFFLFEWKGRNDLNVLRVDEYFFENEEEKKQF